VLGDDLSINSTDKAVIDKDEDKESSLSDDD